MKKIRFLHYTLIVGLLALFNNTACTKFVTVDPPTTQAVSSLVFSNDAAATSAMVGLYSRMTQGNLLICSGALTAYPGQSSDECSYTVSNADNTRFYTNSLIADNGTGNYIRLWRAGYQIIYHANAILEGLEASTTLTASLKAQLQGEALVVRSLCYFYLANLYGAIPFTLQSDYQVNQRLSRTPVADVYQQLVTDLTLAKSLLPTSYASANRARPNRHTATALLARLYLYQKNWAAAAVAATEVIQSGNYSIVANLPSVFIPASGETIWQLAKDNGNTGEGFSFLPSSTTAKPPYALTNYLVNAFEAGDKRKVSWVGKNTVSGTDYYYPYKYKVRASTPITELYVVFRLAEQYLIRAEARAMQNDLGGAKADIDIIRTRAGLSGVNITTQTSFLTALEKERQTELFMEWGHRWQDLIRWGRASAVLGPIKGTSWQPTDVLYPIPLGELQSNSSLTQNPGY